MLAAPAQGALTAPVPLDPGNGASFEAIPPFAWSPVPGADQYQFQVVLAQAVMLATLFSFITLSARNGLTFLPLRDYSYFIAHVRVLGEGRDDTGSPPLQ